MWASLVADRQSSRLEPADALEVALATVSCATATAMVTGGLELLGLRRCNGIGIVTRRDFRLPH